MSEKSIIVISICATAVIAILALSVVEVGKADSAVLIERTKACAASGKQMQPVKIEVGPSVRVELECK